MNILLAEDDENKRDQVHDFVLSMLPDASVDTAGSYQSVLSKLLRCKYDILLLDMTLPTFDKGAGDSSGRLRPFGGVDLLDQISRRSIDVNVIIVTGYDILGNGDDAVSLDELRLDLKRKFPAHFHRAVSYSRSEEQWKDDLRSAIQSLETPQRQK